MKKSLLILALLGIFASGPAGAQTFQNGPYYAKPSWDQQIPDAQRFIVLSNWNNEAVLDRETGLVWERTPSQFTTDWINALQLCHLRHTTGNRSGWRLPSVEELTSLLEFSSSGAVWPSVFLGLNHAVSEFWTSSTVEDVATQAYTGAPSVGGGTANEDKVSNHEFWCVRGGSSVSNPVN